MKINLIVQQSRACVKVLQYINDNIADINSLGAYVEVRRISSGDDLIHSLRRKGITRLPALIGPDGKICIGVNNIIKLFEKNLEGAAPTGSAPSIDIGTNPDMNDFWSRELYSGIDNNGKPIPRVDKDEAEDEGRDIERRMTEYRRNIPKRHRDPDAAPRIVSAPVDDNVQLSDDDKPAPRPAATSSRSPASADDMDERMLVAWLDKNE